MTIIRVAENGAGSSDGSSWNDEISFADFVKMCKKTYTKKLVSGGSSQAQPGDTFYLAGGQSYTLGEAFGNAASPVSGNAAMAIEIVGVNGETDIEASSTEKPTIACGAYAWDLVNYWYVRNLKITTADSQGVRSDGKCTYYNCEIETSANGSGNYAFYGNGDYSYLIGCGIKSTSANGVRFGTGDAVMFCYIHDALYTGIDQVSGRGIFAFNIVANCAGIGHDNNAYANNLLLNNTYHNNGTAYEIPSVGWGISIINCSFTSNTTAINCFGARDKLVTHCNFYNNGQNVVNWTTGYYAQSTDPNFANASAGNYTIQSTGLLDSGYTIENGTSS